MSLNIKYFLTLALFFSLPVLAAQADRNKPVEIEADNASFIEKNQQTEFSGNVIIKQGSLNIHASKVSARRENDGHQYITATGNPVRFSQDLDDKRPDGKLQKIKGHANQITFDDKKNTIIMSGNAYLDREGDVVTGPTATYNTVSSEYFVKGSQKGRVSVILQPTTIKKH